MNSKSVKYGYEKDGEGCFIIKHKKSGEHIAKAPTAEKADFLTKAANNFHYDDESVSESVKPLLSAEEIEKRAESYAGLMVWINKHEEESQEFYEYISAASYKAGAEWAASQLQPSSPQLEQEVKRLQEENKSLNEAIAHYSVQRDEDLAKINELYNEVRQQEVDQSRIKELEQQLSQSDAAGLLDDLISEALLCGYLNGRKQVEERVSVSGYGNRFRDQVEIKKMTIKLLAAISPQSPTLEEGQKDPEQQ